MWLVTGQLDLDGAAPVDAAQIRSAKASLMVRLAGQYVAAAIAA